MALPLQVYKTHSKLITSFRRIILPIYQNSLDKQYTTVNNAKAGCFNLKVVVNCLQAEKCWELEAIYMVTSEDVTHVSLISMDCLCSALQIFRVFFHSPLYTWSWFYRGPSVNPPLLLLSGRPDFIFIRVHFRLWAEVTIKQMPRGQDSSPNFHLSLAHTGCKSMICCDSSGKESSVGGGGEDCLCHKCWGNPLAWKTSSRWYSSSGLVEGSRI